MREEEDRGLAEEMRGYKIRVLHNSVAMLWVR